MRFLVRSVAHCALLSIASLAGAAEEAKIDLRADSFAMLVPPGGRTFVGLPSDRELERRGARIGGVRVVVDDVFEQTLSLAAPYRAVNALHVDTHATTVHQHLLFKTGDFFSRRMFDENERLLREQRYLGEASIRTLRYNDDNTVDVLVRVHDVWTMSPGISIGRKGG